MPLIKCPECGKEMSQVAQSCPNCGKQNANVMQRKRYVRFFWLGTGIFLFPIIFSWFTLRKGYSITARVISISWLVLFYLVFFNTKNVHTPKEMPDNQHVQLDSSGYKYFVEQPKATELAKAQLKESPAYKDYSADANTALLIEVKERLKAPSGADFPWDDLPKEVTTKGVKLSDMSPELRKFIKVARKLDQEDIFRVYQQTLYVDAENSFGAKLRQHFISTFIINTKLGSTKSFVELY